MNIFLDILMGIIIVCFLFTFVNWLFDLDVTNNKLKFKQFLSFYNVNPNRWELCDGYVVCRERGNLFGIRFRFNYIDSIRYLRFCKNKEKRDKLMESNSDYARMIELVKADISKLEAQSKAEMEKAAQDIRNIVNSM